MGYSYGTKWTEELICAELKEIMGILNIKTMPTHSQMIDVMGNTSLENAVVHHGGTKKFAQLIGATIKESESKFGDKYENLCAEEIKKRFGYDVFQTRPRYPYDLLVEKCVKIDAKVSKLYTNNRQNVCFYTFNTEKKEPTCDIFVCYCVNNALGNEKVLIIPAAAISGKTQLSIGMNSVYDKYLDNWELIRKYVSFNKSMIIQ